MPLTIPYAVPITVLHPLVSGRLWHYLGRCLRMPAPGFSVAQKQCSRGCGLDICCSETLWMIPAVRAGSNGDLPRSSSSSPFSCHVSRVLSLLEVDRVPPWLRLGCGFSSPNRSPWKHKLLAAALQSCLALSETHSPSASQLRRGWAVESVLPADDSGYQLW